LAEGAGNPGSTPGRGRARAVLLLAVAALGLLLAVAPMLGGGEGGAGSGPAGSSYATAAEGTKAAYLLLGRLGHRTERRAEPMGDLRRTRLVFLLAPQGRLGGVDLYSVSEWIEAGGTLVYGPTTFEPDAQLLRDGLELPALRIRSRPRTQVPLQGEWGEARALELEVAISTRGARRVNTAEQRVSDLAGRPRETWALVIPRGKGRIYLVDPGAFSNRGLKGADNALFLATLAARHAGGGPILFEEFVHGYGDAVSVLSLARGPRRLAIGLAAAVVALALLAHAWGAGRRLGPPAPEPAPPRRASIEQIESLAAFYAARADRQSALGGLAAWVGLPAPPTPQRDADLLAAARALLAHARGGAVKAGSPRRSAGVGCKGAR
jgi:hypothetical protein